MRSILFGVLQHVGAEPFVHEMTAAERQAWGSFAQLAAEYETIASAAQHVPQVLVVDRSEDSTVFAMILAITARVHLALRRLIPTNRVLDAVHTRSGLTWGVRAILLAIAYGLAALWCAVQAAAEGAPWLSLLALLFDWNATEFLVAGPVATVKLVRVRMREARAMRETAAMDREDVAIERASELVDVSARF